MAFVGIDHPIIAVRDMAQARRAYLRLGFSIPPRGSHIEWGTGNWCIMFPQDYLELRGVVDPTRYLHGLDRFLEVEGEGLMGCAFRPRVSAVASFDALSKRGVEAAAPRELTRNFELPEGVASVRFSLTFLTPGALPGFMNSLVCEHRTPEIMRRPVWLAHDNGARAVRSMSCVTHDLDAFLEAGVRMSEGATAKKNAESATIVLPSGAALHAMTPERARAEGHALKDALPRLLAVALDVADPAAAERLLRSRGVATSDCRGGVRVGPADAHGVALDFVAGEPEQARLAR